MEIRRCLASLGFSCSFAYSCFSSRVVRIMVFVSALLLTGLWTIRSYCYGSLSVSGLSTVCICICLSWPNLSCSVQTMRMIRTNQVAIVLSTHVRFSDPWNSDVFPWEVTTEEEACFLLVWEDMWAAALLRFIRKRVVLGIIFLFSLTYCIVSFMKEVRSFT